MRTASRIAVAAAAMALVAADLAQAQWVMVAVCRQMNVECARGS